MDNGGVFVPSQECAKLTENSNMLYLLIQQSNCLQNDKQIIEVEYGDGEYFVNSD